MLWQASKQTKKHTINHILESIVHWTRWNEMISKAQTHRISCKQTILYGPFFPPTAVVCKCCFHPFQQHKRWHACFNSSIHIIVVCFCFENNHETFSFWHIASRVWAPFYGSTLFLIRWPIVTSFLLVFWSSMNILTDFYLNITPYCIHTRWYWSVGFITSCRYARSFISLLLFRIPKYFDW